MKKRTSKLKIFFLFFIIATNILSAQSDCRDSLLKDFLINKENYSFKKYYSKRKIPRIVFTKIKEISKEKFSLCNPNHKFQSTDLVINPFLKSRQLQFVEKSSKYIIFVYKKGGRGSQTITIICNLEKSEFCVVAINIGKVEGIEDIYDSIKNGQYIYSSVW